MKVSVICAGSDCDGGAVRGVGGQELVVCGGEARREERTAEGQRGDGDGAARTARPASPAGPCCLRVNSRETSARAYLRPLSWAPRWSYHDHQSGALDCLWGPRPADETEARWDVDAMMMGVMSKDMMSMPGMETMDMSVMQACMDACSACEQACTVCAAQGMDDGTMMSCATGVHELREHVQHDDAGDAADAMGTDSGDA